MLFARSLILAFAMLLPPLVALACRADDPITTGRISTIRVTIQGTVEAGGEGVEGVTVTAVHSVGPCSTPTSPRFADSVGTTNSEGRFRRVLSTIIEPYIACFTILAEPPSGSGLGGDSVVVDGVRWDDPGDTVTAMLELPVLPLPHD